MPAAAQITLDSVRTEFEKLAASDWEPAPLIQAYLTALDCEDGGLARPQANAIGAYLRDRMDSQIQKRLGSAKIMKEVWQQIVTAIADSPRPSFDEVGKHFFSMFDQRIAVLTGHLEDPVHSLLEAAGYPARNIEKLRVDVQELKELKQSFLANWPWTSRPLPPVNRDMVARARAALALREGEKFDDMLRRVSAS
jgi:hypothetical protein